MQLHTEIREQQEDGETHIRDIVDRKLLHYTTEKYGEERENTQEYHNRQITTSQTSFISIIAVFQTHGHMPTTQRDYMLHTPF
jgi:hypothetical protein